MHLTKILLISILIIKPINIINAQIDPFFESGSQYEHIQSIPSSDANIHSLVIFSAQQDDLQGDLPNWADDLFSPNMINSLNHFYNVQSNNMHDLSGFVQNKWYYSPYNLADTSEYAYIISVLEQVDQDIDFSDYDNTNNHGGESDSYVDMIFLMIANNPGSSHQPLWHRGGVPYITNDINLNGDSIEIRAESGVVVTYRNTNQFKWHTGVMAHEYGHALGLWFDLYGDTDELELELRSAGIGAYGLMGFFKEYGPVSFCAESKMRLWDYVTEITNTTFDIPVLPYNIYKVVASSLQDYENFLIEYRCQSNFYDSKLSRGLAIWHTHRYCGNNRNEKHKIVDLECADGLWADKGYPAGCIPDPEYGGDNLDFYAPYKPLYNSDYYGNIADNSDLYKGVNYKKFTPYTNPNTNGYEGRRGYDLQNNVTHLAITNIRSDCTFDVIFNYWGQEITENTIWEWDAETKPYYVGENLIIESDTLTISSNCEVNLIYDSYIKCNNGFLDRKRDVVFNPDIPAYDLSGQIYYLRGQYPSVQSALNNCDDGETVIMPRGNYTLEESLTVPANKTLKIESGTVLHLGDNHISSTGGNIVISSGATVEPDIRAIHIHTDEIRGLYPDIQTACDHTNTYDLEVEVGADTYELGDLNIGVYNVVKLKDGVRLHMNTGGQINIEGELWSEYISEGTVITKDPSADKWDGIVVFYDGEVDLRHTSITGFNERGIDLCGGSCGYLEDCRIYEYNSQNCIRANNSQLHIVGGLLSRSRFNVSSYGGADVEIDGCDMSYAVKSNILSNGAYLIVKDCDLYRAENGLVITNAIGGGTSIVRSPIRGNTAGCKITNSASAALFKDDWIEGHIDYVVYNYNSKSIFERSYLVRLGKSTIYNNNSCTNPLIVELDGWTCLHGFVNGMVECYGCIMCRHGQGKPTLDATKAKELLARGIDEHEAEEDDKALKSFKKLLTKYPDSEYAEDAFIYLGHIFHDFNVKRDTIPESKENKREKCKQKKLKRKQRIRDALAYYMDIKNTFKEKGSKHRISELTEYQIVTWLIKNGDYDEAEELINTLLTAYPSKESQLQIKLYKANFLAYNRQNTNGAVEIIEKLLEEYQDDEEMVAILTENMNLILGVESEPLQLEVQEEPITAFGLETNYPNPFNPSTAIPFTLLKEARVQIEVYDITGRRVAQLTNQSYPPGRHTVLFDGVNVSSGVYFIRTEMITAKKQEQYHFTRKITVLK